MNFMIIFVSIFCANNAPKLYIYKKKLMGILIKTLCQLFVKKTLNEKKIIALKNIMLKIVETK